MSEVNNKLNIRTKSVIDSESVNATKILDDDKNYYDNCSVSSAVLSAYLSVRCGLPSGCNGENGHQIWSVVRNVLNKQYRTFDKGCPPFSWLGEFLTTQHRNSLLRY